MIDFYRFLGFSTMHRFRFIHIDNKPFFTAAVLHLLQYKVAIIRVDQLPNFYSIQS